MNNVPRKQPPAAGLGPAPVHNVYSPGQPPPAQTPAPNPNILANYTLPGVISYLTSEFTNLERFKIITNLEKSEMKYKIQQLTSELNTVRYLNEKQAVRIKELEQRLESGNTGSNRDGGKTGLESDGGKPGSKSDGGKPGSKSDGGKTGLESDVERLSVESEKETDNDSAPVENEEPRPQDIPYIDLETVRDARQSLNESIREIIDLLRPPLSAVDSAVRPADSAYADLVEPADSFQFEAPQGLFERYTLKSEDLAEKKAAFEEEVKELNSGPDRADESDAETVTDE